MKNLKIKLLVGAQLAIIGIGIYQYMKLCIDGYEEERNERLKNIRDWIDGYHQRKD